MLRERSQEQIKHTRASCVYTRNYISVSALAIREYFPGPHVNEFGGDALLERGGVITHWKLQIERERKEHERRVQSRYR